MKSIPCILVALIILAATTTGCGKKAEEQATSAGVRQEDGVILPEWAPKNPSPEFIRAAKVLKPLPDEVWTRLGQSQPSALAMIERYKKTFVPAYELFGSLTDEQIERFKTTGQVQVPIKTMIPSERAILDRYFEVWKESMIGDVFGFEDILVFLYKEGANKDLTNVDVGFVSDVHTVNMQFWIVRKDGSVSTPSNTISGI